MVKNTGRHLMVLEASVCTAPALHVYRHGTRFQGEVKIRTQSIGAGLRDALLPPTLPIYTCNPLCIHPSIHTNTHIALSFSCWAIRHLHLFLKSKFWSLYFTLFWFCSSSSEGERFISARGWDRVKRWRMWWSSSLEFLVRVFLLLMCRFGDVLVASFTDRVFFVSGNVIALFLFLSPV